MMITSLWFINDHVCQLKPNFERIAAIIINDYHDDHHLRKRKLVKVICFNNHHHHYYYHRQKKVNTENYFSPKRKLSTK